MQPSTKSFGLTLTLLLTAATRAESDQNLLVNPGFESVSGELNGGEQTNGIGGSGTLVGTRSPFPFGNETVDWSDPVIATGWRTRTVPFGSADGVLAGALHPTNIDGMPITPELR